METIVSKGTIIVAAIFVAIAIQYTSDVCGYMCASLTDNVWGGITLNAIVSYITAYGLIFYVALKLFHVELNRSKFKIDPKSLCYQSLFITGIFAIAFLLSLPCSDSVSIPGGSFSCSKLYSAAIERGISTGFSEELIFRGFLLAWMLKRMSLWPSIIVSSAVFSALHLLVCNSIVELCVYSVFYMSISILISLIYIRQHSLLSVSMFHSIFNIFSYGICSEAPDTIFSLQLSDNKILLPTVIMTILLIISVMTFVQKNSFRILRCHS